MKTYLRLNDVITNKPCNLNSWILDRFKETPTKSTTLKDFYFKITVCFIDFSNEDRYYRKEITIRELLYQLSFNKLLHIANKYISVHSKNRGEIINELCEAIDFGYVSASDINI